MKQSDDIVLVWHVTDEKGGKHDFDDFDAYLEFCKSRDLKPGEKMSVWCEVIRNRKGRTHA